MQSIRLVLVVGLVLGAVQPTFAQTPLPPSARAIFIEELALPALADPTGGRAAIKPEASATIVTGASGARGEFKLGFAAGTNNFFNVTLSTAARGGRAELVLGDEIPSGTKAGFSATRLLFFPTRVNATALPSEIRLTGGGLPAEHLNEYVRRIAANSLETSVGLLLTGSGEYGRENFTFRLTETGPDEAPVLRETTVGAISGGVLVYLKGTMTPFYLGTTFRASRGWKAPQARSICTSASDEDFVECTSVVVGRPQEVNKKSLSFEYRQRAGTLFGLVPQFSIDLADQARGRRLSAEVPLYLVTDGAKEPKLTGGVAIGYRPDGGVYAIVFIGPTFPLLPDRSAERLAEVRSAVAAIR